MAEDTKMKSNEEIWYSCPECRRKYDSGYLREKECPNCGDTENLKEHPPGSILYGHYQLKCKNRGLNVVLS